jgi:hypothetical protein
MSDHHEQNGHHEHHDHSVHTTPAVLNIGDGIGALMIYTSAALHGKEIEVSPLGDDAQRTHTAVLERRVNGRSIFAALFLALAEGDYRIWTDAPNVPQAVTIVSGEVATIDWR